MIANIKLPILPQVARILILQSECHVDSAGYIGGGESNLTFLRRIFFQTLAHPVFKM